MRALSGQAWRAIVLASLAVVVCAGGSCSKRDDAGKITLEFWTLALAPFREYIQASCREFERENPGVSVRWVDVPFDAIDRKLIASAAAGRAPDVINMSDRTFARFVGLGAMADLTGKLPGNADERYFPGVLALGKIDGRLLALPWYLTTQVGMVNRTLLAEGGLRPEDLGTDWRGLQAQARAFHAKTGKYLFSISLGEESQVPILLLGEGLSPLKSGPDGRLEPDLLRPEIVSYVRGWVETYRAGAMPPEAATRDHAHLLDMYQNGRLATIDTGPNFLKRIRQAAPGVYDATQLRAPIVGALGRAHIATMVVGVTTQSRHPELAAKLAWAITSPERQAEFCTLAPILPSTPRTLAESPLFRSDAAQESGTEDPKLVQGRSIAVASLPKGVAFTPALACWPDLRRSMEEHLKRAMIDGRDVEATLAAMSVEWSKILAEAGPQSMDAVPRPAPAARNAEGARP